MKKIRFEVEIERRGQRCEHSLRSQCPRGFMHASREFTCTTDQRELVGRAEVARRKRKERERMTEREREMRACAE